MQNAMNDTNCLHSGLFDGEGCVSYKQYAKKVRESLSFLAN